MNSPENKPVFLLATLIIILGVIFILDSTGVIITPLSITEDEIKNEFKNKGFNVADGTLLVSESYVETEVTFVDRVDIFESGRKSTVFGKTHLASLTGEDNISLQPLLKAKMTLMTDYSSLGSELRFTFPATTTKQTVRVNDNIVEIPKMGFVQNKLENKVLRGIGVSILPSFFETELEKKIDLKTGDIIEFRVDFSGRYEIIETNDADNMVVQSWDGYIEGVSATIVFKYYDPVDLIDIIGEQTESEESENTGCLDLNHNALCDFSEGIFAPPSLPNLPTNNDDEDTTVDETEEDDVIPDEETDNDPTFDNTDPDESSDDTNFYTDTTTTQGENPTGTTGVTVACDPLGTDGRCNEIVNGFFTDSDSVQSMSLVYIIVAVLIIIVIIYIYHKRNNR